MTEHESVKLAAKTFLSKMSSWERRSLNLFRSGRQHQEKVLQELRDIYDTHLTKKAAGRKQARYGLAAFDDPPYFEQEITSIEATSDGGYWVEIPEGMFGKVRLHFVNEDGAWKIDFKESEVDEGKWKKLLDI